MHYIAWLIAGGAVPYRDIFLTRGRPSLRAAARARLNGKRSLEHGENLRVPAFGVPCAGQLSACADECARSPYDRPDHLLVLIELGARHRIVRDPGHDDLVLPIVEGEDEIGDPLLDQRILRGRRLDHDLGAEDLTHDRTAWCRTQDGVEVEGIAKARTTGPHIEGGDHRRILVDRELLRLGLLRLAGRPGRRRRSRGELRTPERGGEPGGAQRGCRPHHEVTSVDSRGWRLPSAAPWGSPPGG